MTSPHPGQVWNPTRGRARPKEILRIGRTGCVWVRSFPAQPEWGATCLRPGAWNAWKERHAAILAPDRPRPRGVAGGPAYQAAVKRRDEIMAELAILEEILANRQVPGDAR